MLDVMEDYEQNIDKIEKVMERFIYNLLVIRMDRQLATHNAAKEILYILTK